MVTGFGEPEGPPFQGVVGGRVDLVFGCESRRGGALLCAAPATRVSPLPIWAARTGFSTKGAEAKSAKCPWHMAWGEMPVPRGALEEGGALLCPAPATGVSPLLSREARRRTGNLQSGRHRKAWARVE